LGGTVTMPTQTPADSAVTLFIDSNIRVVGVKTGVMMDIPVRFLRL